MGEVGSVLGCAACTGMSGHRWHVRMGMSGDWGAWGTWGETSILSCHNVPTVKNHVPNYPYTVTAIRQFSDHMIKTPNHPSTYR